jgi:hypothetical protein
VGSQLRHRASALRRLHKTPNIWGHTYDLNEPGPHFDALIADLYEKSLAVVLELTEPDGFTYAWGDHAMLKFWPQRAERRQLALEIPQPFTDGDLDFGDIYSASDLSWGFQLQAIEALLFGQALIDAFERNKPRVFLDFARPNPSGS